MRVIFFLLTFLAAATVAEAQTAYVTDNLRLGLHRAADTSDRSFRTLESGQELQVIERNRNYAFVRLPDGTEGYVKAAYLVDDKPAKLIVTEAQAEADRLQQELAALQESFAQPAARIASLEQQVEQRDRDLAASIAQVQDLDQANAEFSERLNAYKNSLPLSWVGGATVVCLLAGFIAGLWWTDHRSRRRHGGVRIY